MESHKEALGVIRRWPGYEPTALRELEELAGAANVASMAYKDEASRFGLGSFKALGGAYGVLRVLMQEIEKRHPGSSPTFEELMEGRYKEVVSKLTVTCATDGNHGRAVAWGARLFGCRCVVYIHTGVSTFREKAIASLGARVVRWGATYDEAVRRCSLDAEGNGWVVVSDTSYPGYTEIPRNIMQGYTVLIHEAVEAMDPLPTHVFVQGGVGGLAASVCGYLWHRLGVNRPRVIVVEPHNADCIFRSAKKGRPSSVEGPLDTVMAGLACGEVSIVAWEILREAVNFFVTISDHQAIESMRLLARMGIVAGESGVASLAGLLACLRDDEAREAIGMGPGSTILVLGTEGATDPEIYRKLVGECSGG
jgi:diaminopropionate ammonia-lyase